MVYHETIILCGAFCWIDEANVSNLILTITALCSNLEHLHLTFNTVGRWRELGEVENKCTSHKIILSAILCQKLSKSVEIWQIYSKNNFALFFWDTV